MKIIPKCIKSKRHLCASGSILLPLAQKWGLVGVVAVAALSAFGAQSASAASLTLSTPSNLSVNVTPSTTGAFAKSTKGTITVKSDAYAGYTLKIQDKDSNSALEGKNGSIPSITETAGIAESAFNSDSKYNNMWGYRPSKFHDVANTNFLPSPSATGDVIETINPSNSTLKSTDYTVELGVRVDNNQPAGTYTGTFVFTVTANDLKYSITYDDNNADGNNPTNKSGTAPEGTQVSLASAPTRNGYVFLGWCDRETRGEDCSGGIEYKAGGNYKLTNSANNVTLYAMWAAIPTTMQNFTPGYCKYMTVEKDVITLKDERDDNEYRVAKLKDNKCWMIDNLRLGSTLDPDTGTMQLNSATSDTAKDGFTLQMTPVDLNNNGNYDIDAAYIDETYGGYYSWHTATAGTGTEAMAIDGDNATNSICPRGWKLPTGGPKDNDFQMFIMAYENSNSKLQNSPVPGLMNSGYIWNKGNGFGRKDQDARLWSSTTRSDHTAYDLYTYYSDVESGHNDLKHFGQPMRCIARD